MSKLLGIKKVCQLNFNYELNIRKNSKTENTEEILQISTP